MQLFKSIIRLCFNKKKPTTTTTTTATTALNNINNVNINRLANQALKVYVDGSRKPTGRASYGIWYGPNDPRNVGREVCPETQGLLTSIQAEDYAILMALFQQVLREKVSSKKLIIHTDSYNSISRLKAPFFKLQLDDKYIFQSNVLVNVLKQKGCTVEFEHVRKRAKIEGTREAHKLARQDFDKTK